MSDKTDIFNHVAPLGQKVAAGISYATGGGLVIGDVLDFLDHYAGAFGVLIGLGTFFVNWYYARKGAQRRTR